jgi:outer membrane lipoprotein-sorting protein
MNRRTLLTSAALASLAACHPMPPPPPLSPADAAEVRRIEAYLNTLRSLQARFIQVWPNGRTTPGTAWLERPGRLRLQYDPPSPLTLIAANGIVRLHDAANDSNTTMPVSSTPLGILLADNISLSGPVTVTGVQRAPGQVQVSMVRTSASAQGSLTLSFIDPPLTLRGVRIIDAEQQETRLILFDLRIGGHFQPSLFSPTT